VDLSRSQPPHAMQMPTKKRTATKTRATQPKPPSRSVRASSTKRAAPTTMLPMPSLLCDANASADIVKVPVRSVLALDGQGAPESESFQRSVGAIYGVVYTLKFARKKQGGEDFKIGPLEARWWAEGVVPRSIAQAPRQSWRWQLRMAVPRDVSTHELRATINAATSKGRLEGSSEAAQVRLQRLPVERYGRILHRGPYGQEGASFERIVTAIEDAGLRPGNAHLEVYLNDPRRTKPERLKTVLLLEVAKA
jgi:hypothetical protein